MLRGVSKGSKYFKLSLDHSADPGMHEGTATGFSWGSLDNTVTSGHVLGNPGMATPTHSRSQRHQELVTSSSALLLHNLSTHTVNTGSTTLLSNLNLFVRVEAVPLSDPLRTTLSSLFSTPIPTPPICPHSHQNPGHCPLMLPQHHAPILSKSLC